MNTRFLLMLLAILGVGVVSMPAYSVCGDFTATSHNVTNVTNPCLLGTHYCGGDEKHWRIVFPYYTSHTYSNARLWDVGMSGNFQGDPVKNKFIPNKSGRFGWGCLGQGSSTNCARCTNNSTCSNSAFKANICH